MTGNHELIEVVECYRSGTKKYNKIIADIKEKYKDENTYYNVI